MKNSKKKKQATDLPVLHPGYDTFAPAPGKHQSMSCTTCGDKMNVERNVMSATSWAEAMGERKHLHDLFVCPNAGADWHIQVIALMYEAKKTVSTDVEKIIREEIAALLKTRKATKKVSACLLG